MQTKGYVDAIRALTRTGSVYAAAQLLGMNEDTVRSYALGRSYPDAYACARIAEALDLPVEQVIAEVNAEKEKDPERKAYWMDLARKFAACVVMGSAITTAPSDAHSATGQAQMLTLTAIDLPLYKLCVYALRHGRGWLIGWLYRARSARAGRTYQATSPVPV